MSTSRRVQWLLMFGLFGAVAGGCMAPDPIYTAAQPGPWADFKVSVTPAPGKITIAVDGHPTQPGDYILRIDLVDQKQRNVGQRVFDYGDEPKETFLMAPDIRQVVATITSTTRGQWRSGAVDIPPVKK